MYLIAIQHSTTRGSVRTTFDTNSTDFYYHLSLLVMVVKLALIKKLQQIRTQDKLRSGFNIYIVIFSLYARGHLFNLPLFFTSFGPTCSHQHINNLHTVL